VPRLHDLETGRPALELALLQRVRVVVDLQAVHPRHQLVLGEPVGVGAGDEREQASLMDPIVGEQDLLVG
jgi:hypothetical protein